MESETIQKWLQESGIGQAMVLRYLRAEKGGSLRRTAEILNAAVSCLQNTLHEKERMLCQIDVRLSQLQQEDELLRKDGTINERSENTDS